VNMHNLIIQYAVLLAVILFIVMLAERIKVAYPILLIITGLVLGFVPFLRGIEIKPDLIFVIFLPPLLYESAWNTSWKDLWKWRRIILSFAFLIVIVTSCVIAYVSDNVIPGFTLALGFLLGGIISPPDAVSASAILKNIKVPKRFTVIVEGESLLNDASGLIVFKYALGAIMTGTFVFHEAALSFVMVVVMGTIVGVGVALIFYAIHRWMPTNANMDVILTFLTPYAMYMTAEEFHFSGVLAVVSGGLFLSYRRHTFLSNRSRMQGINVWEAVAFVLNGLVFMLIGLEFPVIIKDLGPNGLEPAIKYSLIITGVLILTRFASTYGATIFTIFISKYITTADSNPGFKAPILLGWTGMRGVVSLAAALSIPLALPSGAAFPQRDMILFITFTVIVVTVVLQGLTLPALVKWVKLPDLDNELPLDQQRQLVRKKLSLLSISILEDKYAKQLTGNDMVKSLKMKLDSDMELLNDWQKDNNQQRADEFYHDYREITDALRDAQRTLLHTLNKKENISDDIIKQQLELLDLEEEKMRQAFQFDL
jgi:Na+/H+ antiporter